MSDVRRRWGPFFAGAGAPAALTGVGSTATVGLDARMLPDRFCGDAVAALWGVLCVRAVAAPAVGADPASGTASG